MYHSFIHSGPVELLPPQNTPAALVVARVLEMSLKRILWWLLYSSFNRISKAKIGETT
jgi:hypothetical protein